MARDLLVDLLLAVAAKPHSKCIRHGLNIVQHRAYALKHSSKTKISSPASPPPVHSNADPLLTPRKPSQIPLAVGLDRNPHHRSAISQIPIPKGEKGETFIPAVLARPLGLQTPPRSGQNSPVDQRTWAERKADFASRERAVERRQVYLRTFFRPYFQEWRRTEHHKGKTFQSNERLFKKDKALYFPNMWGSTLYDSAGADTTPVLRGKISIVAIQSNRWGEEQVDTFFSKEANPELQTLLEQNKERVQRVDINVTTDIARQMLVRLFTGGLRRAIPEERWSRYFMIRLPRDVRMGLSDDVRDAMGFLNTQVGYVYLLDEDCKIRWAGSGHAWKGEIESLNAGLKRLLEESRHLQPATRTREAAPPEELGAQPILAAA